MYIRSLHYIADLSDMLVVGYLLVGAMNLNDLVSCNVVRLLLDPGETSLR